MDPNDAYEYSDELNEGRRRIRGGCTIGRVINLCIALDFFVVLITALIVSGSLGAVNLTLQRSYKDRHDEHTPIQHEVCVLYSSCDVPESTMSCDFHYNTSGVCKFVEVAFGFIGLVALIYIIISIVRAILTTNIWFTVFADLAVILFSVVVAFSAGVTISIGLSVTCASVISRYDGLSPTCDRSIPFLRPKPSKSSDPSTPDPNDAYAFYHPVNVAQSCAWLCFAFLAVLFIISIVRIIIFIKRRRGSGGENIDDITDVLSKEHNDDEEEYTKPI